MSANAFDLLMVGSGLVSGGWVQAMLAAGGAEVGRLRTVACVDQALPLLKNSRFDATLMALERAGASALDGIAALDLAAPEVPILVLSARDDPLLGEMALRAGAEDCLLPAELDGRRLIRAIRFARERRRKLAKLTRLAWTDALTGLPNRALLRDRLENMLARARRHDTLVGVLFVDLDGFKQVNDGVGHAGGDLLLQRVAARLQGCVRKSDTVARIGGDEFVVALDSIGGRADADEVAATVRALLQEPFRLQGVPVRIAASIGIAVDAGGEGGIDRLLRRADRAMYRDKQARKAMPDAFAAQAMPAAS